MTLPLGLRSAIESGECVLFVGAGIGHNMVRPDGTTMPDGTALAKSLASRFSIPVDETPDLAQVAQVVELRHDRARLISHIERELAGFEPDESLRWLASLTWRAIFTTNYDLGMERAYQLVADPTQTPVSISTNADSTVWDPRFEVPIFHLHGSMATDEAKSGILLTEQDYSTFRARRQMLFDQLRVSYATIPILYIGYSHRDPNWKMVTTELRAEFEPQRPPQSYRVAPGTPPLEQEILAAQGVATIDGTLADLRRAVVAELGEIHVSPTDLGSALSKIPTELRALFEKSPAAVSRLLNSWDYVNQADFGGLPNTKQFLLGDRPNWSLVGQGINFQRDLEEPIVEQLVEFATDPSPRITAQIVLGPAGFGISTVLMAVAAWFVQNKVGTTLFLRPGAVPVPADVEFASRYFPSPIVFCVDNAADVERELAEVQILLRDAGVPAFMLMGERLNEWRQCRPTLRPREVVIDPLSDGEIHRLLDALGRANSLGKLADLDPDLQFAAIKVRNQQQLLVSMREATEGRAFDAIIEDEYRGIRFSKARELYALVCAFSRVRALARDALCADAISLPISDLYQLLSPSMEGIVDWETIDEARGIEALRARHQIIAEIVWTRCLDATQRSKTLLDAMNCLNLTFSVDAKAFEAFTRDSDAVDALQDLETKTRFFELACRKDPASGFVRQHYARMLLREQKFELALGQVDKGIELAPRARVIHHTRGVILREIALRASSSSLARRRLVQSEEAFEGALRQNPRDEYSYQSLAELYLEWARRSANAEESVDYLKKAQEVVFRGLQKVRQREGLYLVRARIENEVGDQPARIAALRLALEAAPNSGVVRFVLGTALRRENQFPEAIKILVAGLTETPDDPFLSIALSLTYHESGRDYRECVSVLHLARLKGEADPEFVAIYGGMLAMDGQIDEARDVWSRSSSRNFSSTDASRLVFRPHPGHVETVLTGKVKSVKSAFSFVTVEGYPDFFWPHWRYEDASPAIGDRIEFTPGYSARGAEVAERKF